MIPYDDPAHEVKQIGRALRYIALVVLVLWGLAWSCGVAYAQALPPLTSLRVTREAARSLDSLASTSRDDRVETAGCVTAYSVRDSVLTIERVTSANYLRADSTTIYTDTTGGTFRPVCPVGVPSVHAHVAYGGYPAPSPTDIATQQRVGIWCLLLSVLDNGWRVIAYGRRGETP